MGHSSNLGNIKVTVTFTTRKPPSLNIWQTKSPNFFLLQFFFFLRGEGGASTPYDPVSCAYGNYHNSMFQWFNVRQQEFGKSEGATFESAIFWTPMFLIIREVTCFLGGGLIG